MSEPMGPWRFSRAGKELSAEPYHYKACGLDDVFLLNGFEIEETPYGSGVTIEHVDALHEAIALHLISDPKPLTAREFRYLRKQMGLTQQALAEGMRLDVQTIGRYEKDQTAISGPADSLIRIQYALSRLPEDEQLKVLHEMIERLERKAGKGARGTYYEQTEDGWSARDAA